MLIVFGLWLVVRCPLESVWDNFTMEDEYSSRNVVTVRSCVNLMSALVLQVNAREMKEVHCVNVTLHESLKICAHTTHILCVF